MIYITSTSPSAVQEFSDYAKTLEPPMDVVTISDLLPGKPRGKKGTKAKEEDNEEMKRAMKEMTQEQREVIDYVLLENAAYFAGMAESTLAWDVAMSRAERRGGEGAGCKVEQKEGGKGSWRDGWSEIMGAEMGREELET